MLPRHGRRAAGRAPRGARRAAHACAGHPALFAHSVVNEISPDIARWSGARAVERFIEELVDAAKQADPECLCTFGSYPPTEFLRPENIDFFCFNVYLHQQRAYENYLARLQMLADAKPLILGETGIDSLREGRAASGANSRLANRIGLPAAALAGARLFSVLRTTGTRKGRGSRRTTGALGSLLAIANPSPSFDVVERAKFWRRRRLFPLPRHAACFGRGRVLQRGAHFAAVFGIASREFCVTLTTRLLLLTMAP